MPQPVKKKPPYKELIYNRGQYIASSTSRKQTIPFHSVDTPCRYGKQLLDSYSEENYFILESYEDAHRYHCHPCTYCVNA